MKCEIWKGETSFYCAVKLNLGSEAVWEVPDSQVLIFIYPAYGLGMAATDSTAMLGDTVE